MKQKNFHNKTKKQHVTRPFEGKINQFKREKLVLCSMVQFEGFKKALKDADIDYDLGDFFGDNIVIVKK